MVFSTGSRGTYALVPGAPPLHSFFTGLDVCRVVFRIFSLVSPAAKCPYAALVVFFFQFFLKYVITELLPPSQMGSAFASRRSILEVYQT